MEEKMTQLEKEIDFFKAKKKSRSTSGQKYTDNKEKSNTTYKT